MNLYNDISYTTELLVVLWHITKKNKNGNATFMNSQTVNFKLQSYTTPDLIPDLFSSLQLVKQQFISDTTRIC